MSIVFVYCFLELIKIGVQGEHFGMNSSTPKTITIKYYVYMPELFAWSLDYVYCFVC